MIRITEETKVQPLKIRMEDEPAFCFTAEDTSEVGPWYHDIKGYLQTCIYPKNAN